MGDGMGDGVGDGMGNVDGLGDLLGAADGLGDVDGLVDVDGLCDMIGKALLWLIFSPVVDEYVPNDMKERVVLDWAHVRGTMTSTDDDSEDENGEEADDEGENPIVQMEVVISGDHGSVFIDKTQAIIGGKINVLSTIDQQLVYCSNEEGKLYQLQNIMNEGQLETPCVIFMQSKERVKEIYHYCKKLQIYVDYLHNNMSLLEREKKVKEFMDKEKEQESKFQ